jgi:MFS family permease
MMAGIMAVAMIAGPLAGGFITDNLNWRWAFYVNLPIGGLAFALLVLRLHLPRRRTEHRIDWLGAALLSVGITALVLITTWGGTEFPWGSWQVIGLAVLALTTLGLFLLVESRVAEPILPLGLFRNRNFALVSAIGFLLGFALFGAVNFLPLYQQTVQGASATNSGLLLLPMMLGLMVVSVGIGQAITRTGRYRVFPIVGGVVMTAGMVLLALIDARTSKLQLSLFMVVLGAGMGFLMQTTMLIAQNSVEPKDLGVASSSATFFRSIGGSFGVALFGTIFVRRLESDLTASLGSAAAERMTSGGGQVDPARLGAMPAPLRGALLHGIAEALADVFFWAVPVAAVVAGLALFIRQVTLRSENDAPTAHEAPEEQAAAIRPV